MKIESIDSQGNIRVWNTQSEACRELCVYQSTVSKCLSGEYKTAGGYRFRYHLLPQPKLYKIESHI